MQNIVHTVATALLDDNREALFWSDGSVEIEDWRRNFEDEPTLPHILLDKEQAVALRDFLNGLDL
jgi:hypothetical protein